MSETKSGNRPEYSGWCERRTPVIHDRSRLLDYALGDNSLSFLATFST